MICPKCGTTTVKQLTLTNGEEAFAVCSVFGPDLEIFDWGVDMFECANEHVFYVPPENPVTWSDEEE